MKIEICLYSVLIRRFIHKMKSLPILILVLLSHTLFAQSVSEPHRPLFHFSPPSHWMNDPNGLVYHEGEYHLFYQHYPEAIVWGPMHWGHAVSTDLVHWKHLPIALYPDSLGLIFSGSAVIDKHNSAGFGKNAMIAIFTHHHMDMEKAGSNVFQYQSIAYSTDRGRSFKKYQANPVIKNPGIRDFRDPKVRWDEKRKQWIMVFAAYDKALFYTSANLKDWNKSGEFGIPGDKRLWECPDLFPMKVNGTNEQKWILITSIQRDAPNGGTATSYFVGDFDGKVFKGDTEKQSWLDYGKDNYAFVTWNNLADGRTIGVGWMSNWQYANAVPTQSWRNAATIPRELNLVRINNEYRLIQKPVKELTQLRNNLKIIPQAIINDRLILDSKSIAKEIEFTVDLIKSGSHSFGIELKNNIGEHVLIGYDALKSQFYIDRTQAGKKDFSKDYPVQQYAPRISKNKHLKIRMLIDASSVELFADDGLTIMTSVFFPNEDFTVAELFSKNGETKLIQGKWWTLNTRN